MLILGIDSSGMTASAALVTEEKILAEMSVNNKKTHSQTLLPMVARMMDSVDLPPDAVDLIAVAEGPGSFTGLRIGAGLAKGLGLALDKPIIGISTIDAMAYALGPCGGLICPMIDARHETVYTGLYTWQFPDKGTVLLSDSGSDKGTVLLSDLGAGMQTLIETRAMSLRELAEQIAELDAEGTFGQRDDEGPAQSADEHSASRRVLMINGDGAEIYQEAFEGYLREAYQKAGLDEASVPRVALAPLHLRMQRAAALGALALDRSDEAVSSDDFAPDYHRVTQAERMKQIKEQAQMV